MWPWSWALSWDTGPWKHQQVPSAFGSTPNSRTSCNELGRFKGRVNSVIPFWSMFIYTVKANWETSTKPVTWNFTVGDFQMILSNRNLTDNMQATTFKKNSRFLWSTVCIQKRTMIHSWIFMHTVIGTQVKNIPGTQTSSTFLSCFPPRAISLLTCRLVLSQIGFVKIIHLKSLLIWTKKQSQTSKKKRTVDSMWRSETHKTHLLGPFINKFYLLIFIYYGDYRRGRQSWVFSFSERILCTRQ